MKTAKIFFKYAFFGSFGVLVDFIIYTVLVMVSINYQLGNLIGYIGGTLVSFLLNRLFTFKIRTEILERFLKFSAVASIGYLSSVFLLWISVEKMLLDEITSKVITLIFIVFIQFSLNKAFTFKEL